MIWELFKMYSLNCVMILYRIHQIIRALKSQTQSEIACANQRMLMS